MLSAVECSSSPGKITVFWYIYPCKNNTYLLHILFAELVIDRFGKNSKALITTDMGLVLAIPALGAYHYLKQKLSIAELAVEEALEAMFATLDSTH